MSGLIRSSKIDGKQVDLNQISISRPTLERKRINNRSVLMMQKMQDFEKNKPEYAGLHWDGKLMMDVTGKLQ